MIHVLFEPGRQPLVNTFLCLSVASLKIAFRIYRQTIAVYCSDHQKGMSNSEIDMRWERVYVRSCSQITAVCANRSGIYFRHKVLILLHPKRFCFLTAYLYKDWPTIRFKGAVITNQYTK
jgi:hypothetical protein